MHVQYIVAVVTREIKLNIQYEYTVQCTLSRACPIHMFGFVQERLRRIFQAFAPLFTARPSELRHHATLLALAPSREQLQNVAKRGEKVLLSSFSLHATGCIMRNACSEVVASSRIFS